MKRGTKSNTNQDVSYDGASPEEHDIIVVGAGLSGINLGYRLQTQAKGFSYTILEMRDVIGGTWDLMRFPGIRSDSDLATFGFSFHPWPYKESIAKGHLIRAYIRDTARAYDIDKKIRFNHKVEKAEWSSQTARWTVTAIDSSEVGDSVERKFQCKFLVWGSGYYDYHEPLKVNLPGLENFKGPVMHPQFWPEDFDYSGKRVLLIGSGATAITMLPAVAEKAGHVTMLQRSPSYIASIPQVDPIGETLRKYLPRQVAYQLTRVKNYLIGYYIYYLSRTNPEKTKKMLRDQVEPLLPPHIPFEPHFVPKYNPWEQRLCMCPDGDFFQAFHKGNCSIVTDHIETFTETGVKLQSGDSIETDIVVTATGLKLQLLGGAKMFVDGEQIHMGDKIMWKGTMVNDVPNAAFVIGYAQEAWTLGSDVCAKLICRILNQMRTKNMDVAVTRIDATEKPIPEPLLKLSSTYVRAGADELPKSSNISPWVGHSTFYKDFFHACWAPLGNRLHFAPAGSKDQSEASESSKLL